MAKINDAIPYMVACIIISALTYYAFERVGPEVGYVAFAIAALTFFQALKSVKDSIVDY